MKMVCPVFLFSKKIDSVFFWSQMNFYNRDYYFTELKEYKLVHMKNPV